LPLDRIVVKFLPVLDPTKRFSNRVDNYVKYRPTYPPQILPLLESDCGLTAESIIGDVGSGTGLLTELFLKNGNQVFGVEPNPEMRAAGEKILARYSNFTSVDAVAEATTLPDHSVDFIVVGQAFHWFDRAKTREEFVRILKLDGWVMVAWNGYRVKSGPLMAAYQDLVVRYGTDYSEVQREVEDCDVESFYDPATCICARFEFQQSFDYQGLKGRFLSASYALEPDHPEYEAMLSDLRKIFDANQQDGKVIFAYETVLYYGHLRAR
jgi:SAM-dependent methyltransferase